MKSSEKPSQSSHLGSVLDTIDGYDVIECTVCGFKHINPIPTQEELEERYAKTFYQDEKKDYLKDAEADLEWWQETYKNQYALFEQHTKGRRLLDIGSGPGYFLKCGQDLGWEVLGFEPSHQAYEYSSNLGVKVVENFFNAETIKSHGTFDVVCLNLVLEHLPNPAQFLQEAQEVLNPGGLMMIVSPNDYNPLQSILTKKQGFDPWWVVPSHHINYFDFKSIQGLLVTLGFEIADALATYPIEFFLLGGENYIGKREIGRACHERRKNLEMSLYKNNPELLNTLYRDMAKNNVGREFVVLAKKGK